MDNTKEISELESKIACLTEENCHLKKTLEQMQSLKLMTLDEAIKHFEDSAENLNYEGSQISRGNMLNVANWLRQLKLVYKLLNVIGGN